MESNKSYIYNLNELKAEAKEEPLGQLEGQQSDTDNFNETKIEVKEEQMDI